MPNYRRANTKGGTYFFTVVTYRRQRILGFCAMKTFALPCAPASGMRNQPIHLPLMAFFQMDNSTSTPCNTGMQNLKLTGYADNPGRKAAMSLMLIFETPA